MTPPGLFRGLRTVKYSVADLAGAKAWYTEVLGFAPYFDEPYYVGFNVEGFELGLDPDGETSTSRVEAGIAYWGVADARQAWTRLLALGAAPHAEIQDVGGGLLIGSLHDPFGNILGVIENPHFTATPRGAGQDRAG